MERHGHLQLECEVRRRLLEMSPATIDRLLKPVRDAGRQGRRRSGITTALRRSIAVRTFSDWNTMLKIRARSNGEGYAARHLAACRSKTRSV
jgi:hypothetical protein